jgi:hypothetical protein
LTPINARQSRRAQVGCGSFRPSRPGIKCASRGEIVESALHVLRPTSTTHTGFGGGDNWEMSQDYEMHILSLTKKDFAKMQTT